METEQNVALLREGIVLLSNDGKRAAIAGFDASRVREAAARVLGEAIEIDLVGTTAREIRPHPCLGYREREPRRLQLRIEIVGDEHVDEIVVAEDGATVVVYATICSAVDGEDGACGDVPHHVWLRQPLGDRVVIDGTTGERLEARPAPV